LSLRRGDRSSLPSSGHVCPPCAGGGVHLPRSLHRGSSNPQPPVRSRAGSALDGIRARTGYHTCGYTTFRHTVVSLLPNSRHHRTPSSGLLDTPTSMSPWASTHTHRPRGHARGARQYWVGRPVSSRGYTVATFSDIFDLVPISILPGRGGEIRTHGPSLPKPGQTVCGGVR
jgi:hypothetical protein